MNRSDTTMKVLTLGRFSISMAGKPVAVDWPDETLKVFFCSLLSPLDIYFTWDRICRAMLGVAETRDSRRQLESTYIRPLNNFLFKELGFNPIIAGHEGISIDQHVIHVDALEFYRTVLEGLRLMSLTDHSAAIKKFSKANALYVGCYLPGMQGKIIINTRKELESLYRTALIYDASELAVRKYY